MNLFKNIFLVSCFSLLTTGLVFAQDSTAVKNMGTSEPDSLMLQKIDAVKNNDLESELVKAKTPNEAIAATLNAFVRDYSDFGKTKDKMKVLAYMSRDLVYNIVNFDIRNKHELIQSDFNGFNKYLNKLLEEDHYVVDYKITEMVSNEVTHNLGVVVYNAEYQTSANGAVWTRGSETVTMTFKKTNGKWKIIYFTVIGREDEKFRGICICELYKAAKGGYIAKTNVPSGRSYDSHMNNFSFIKSTGGRIYIKSDGKTYRWTNDGSIFLETHHDSNGVYIGKAMQINELDGIIEILKSSIFTVNCTEIKLIAR
jgi:ketosteroid isomerase-like protein